MRGSRGCAETNLFSGGSAADILKSSPWLARIGDGGVLHEGGVRSDCAAEDTGGQGGKAGRKDKGKYTSTDRKSVV